MVSIKKIINGVNFKTSFTFVEFPSLDFIYLSDFYLNVIKTQPVFMIN